MNIQQNREIALTYLRNPEFPQTVDAYFQFRGHGDDDGKDGEICGHCALGALWYSQYRTSNRALSDSLSRQFGLTRQQLKQIIRWNDRDHLTLGEIADRLEAIWNEEPQNENQA